MSVKPTLLVFFVFFFSFLFSFLFTRVRPLIHISVVRSTSTARAMYRIILCKCAFLNYTDWSTKMYVCLFVCFFIFNKTTKKCVLNNKSDVSLLFFCFFYSIRNTSLKTKCFKHNNPVHYLRIFYDRVVIVGERYYFSFQTE